MVNLKWRVETGVFRTKSLFINVKSRQVVTCLTFMQIINYDFCFPKQWFDVSVRCLTHVLKGSSDAKLIYIYAFSRHFYPKRVTVHSGYNYIFFLSMCVPWELNPQPFALLTQCSTTEPQEHFYLLFELKCVLAVCVHVQPIMTKIHPIMIKIHPVCVCVCVCACVCVFWIPINHKQCLRSSCSQILGRVVTLSHRTVLTCSI